MKKWYIASRMRHRESVNIYAKIITEHGDELSYQWSAHPSLFPYHVHQKKCQEVASEIVQALHKTDIFVLISDVGGTDMFIELGIILGSSDDTKVYIIGEHNKRSLMQLHSRIIHCGTLVEVFDQEGYSQGEYVQLLG